MLRLPKVLLLTFAAWLFAGHGVASAAPSTGELKVIADTVWVLIAGFLVFFMNAGFGCVEAGFCRAKNAVNILGKNFIVFAIATIAFWAVGWALMFGDGNAYIGASGFMVEGEDNSPAVATLDAQIKDDIKKDYKLDLKDEKVAEDKANKALVDAIAALQEKAGTKAGVDSLKETVKIGDDEVEAVTVSLVIPGKSEPFVKTYPVTNIYFGVYGAIAWAGVPLMAKFFFQLVFAGTAATIVSGCVAERIHYGSFMIFALFVVALSYPITGHWIWGGGFLAGSGFWDFAGSTVVHSVGGWAGLAGILLLGPRLGKYKADGTVQPIPGHSMALAFLGGLILWLGWFGFNPGSTMTANALDISRIVITTNLACAAGMLMATLVAFCLTGKPDFSMTVNGALAGLVAVTAPCIWVSNLSAIIIGGMGGIFVVFAVYGFDKLKIDDPVGALSVHLVNGIWGTLAVGLFANPAVGYDPAAGPAIGLLVGGGAGQLITQFKGVLFVGAFTFAGSLLVWSLIKYTVGIRVEEQIEIEGLDVHEMGMEAYSGFQHADPIEYTHPSSEPKSAKMPPGGKRYSVVVDGATNGELLSAWSEMCQPGKASDAAAFKGVYPFMTTVVGNKFNFRGGDPEAVKINMQKLFSGTLRKNVSLTVQ